MDKATFINTLKETRAEWDALLARVGEGRMLEPGAAGKWSVKDIIAHVMWGELEIVPIMGTHVLSGSELWNLSEDERNEIVYQQYRDRPLQDIVTEEWRVYDQFLEAAQTLSDEDLNDPHHFRDMPEAWIPWRIFAGCSFQHYRDHMPSIQNAAGTRLPLGDGRKCRLSFLCIPVTICFLEDLAILFATIGHFAFVGGDGKSSFCLD